uniref:Uncharacterized protein n=1 Tax=Oryza glumipatula TaxID=40148 RepID=A0A0E0BSU8_9ORYZ
MGSSSKATASNPLGGSTILEKLSKTNHALDDNFEPVISSIVSKTEPMINFWERHTPSGSALSSAWPVDKPPKRQSIWPIEDVAANRAGTMATMTTGTMEATTVQTATEIMETVPPAGAKEELIPGASANSAIKEDIYTNLGIYFSLIQICGTST